MLSVTKIVKFDAAHFLPDYEGKCKNMHGHTWKVEVEISRSNHHLDSGTGMVFDFSVLKQILQRAVLDKLDHRVLNDVVNLENPTAEWLCEWIESQLTSEFGFGLRGEILVNRIRVWESEDSYAEWRKE